MTHPFRRWARAVVCAAAVAASAVPAARAGETLTLSLDAAMQRAIEQNNGARLAALGQDEAHTYESLARAARLPHLEAVFTQSSNQVNLATFGFTIPGQPNVIGPFAVTEAVVRGAWTVFDRAAQARIARAKRGEEVAVTVKAREDEDIAAATASLYFALQRAEVSARDARATLTLFERVRTLARDQVRAGVATRLDTLRAAVQVSRQRQVIVQADAARETARLALRRVLGAELDGEVVLTDSLPRTADASQTAETLVAHALESRADYAEARAAIASARAEVVEAQAGKLPTVTLQGLATAGGTRPNNLELYRSLNVQVAMPLFTGGALKVREDQARLHEAQAEIRAREARRAIEEDVKRAQISVGAASSRIDLAAQSTSLAEQEFEVATDRFRQGVATDIDVDYAQTALSNARDADAAARAEYAQALVSLLRAGGYLLTPTAAR